MNTSAYIRAVIQGRRLIVCDELPELIRQIIKIGVNTNQVKTVAVLSGSVSTEGLQKLDEEIAEIQRLTRKTVRVLLDSKERKRTMTIKLF